MRLLIVSHTPHYRHRDGIVGWGATIREIDELATLFSSVTHIAPLYAERAPASALAYRAVNLRLRAVPPAGGRRWRDKCGILFRCPEYLRAILQERRRADVIHVRAPANLSLLTLPLLALLRRPRLRWVKYAGDWSGGRDEPQSYRLQRWWLARGWHRGLVTINGHWPDQPAHVRSWLNPCLTATELREGLEASRAKQLCPPVRLLFVGRLEAAKGAGICLEILAQLAGDGVAASLDLIGDGLERGPLERRAQDLGLADRVTFHGGLPRDALNGFYAAAHFILLPSVCSEGWPKVLSEAMAYGVLPVAHGISSIPEVLHRCSTGRSIPTPEPRLFSAAIASYLEKPLQWREHSQNAVLAASAFSYEKYLEAVRRLLDLPHSMAYWKGTG